MAVGRPCCRAVSGGACPSPPAPQRPVKDPADREHRPDSDMVRDAFAATIV